MIEENYLKIGRRTKRCIQFQDEEIVIESWTGYRKFLDFHDEEKGNLFLKNFEDLIMIAKPLL